MPESPPQRQVLLSSPNNWVASFPSFLEHPLQWAQQRWWLSQLCPALRCHPHTTPPTDTHGDPLVLPGWLEGLKTTAASYLWRKTISTLTSSRSLCKKSFRKLETLSSVMCPQTTMCLNKKGQLDEAIPETPWHPPLARQRKAHSCREAFMTSEEARKAPAPFPRGLWGKAAGPEGAQRLLDRKAYGFSPDATQNPIKSPTAWPSGFMHLKISDIMLALKRCIIKPLADSYLSLSAHKASSQEIYRMSLGLWHRAYQVMR